MTDTTNIQKIYKQSGIELVATFKHSDNSKKFWHVCLQIRNRTQDTLMENGAHVIVLSRKLVDSFSSRPTLHLSQCWRFVSFTKTFVLIDNVSNLPMKYSSISILFYFFVVPNCSPVIGTSFSMDSVSKYSSRWTTKLLSIRIPNRLRFNKFLQNHRRLRERLKWTLLSVGTIVAYILKGFTARFSKSNQTLPALTPDRYSFSRSGRAPFTACFHWQSQTRTLTHAKGRRFRTDQDFSIGL